MDFTDYTEFPNQYQFNVTWAPFATILSVLAIIGMWQLFENNKEAGWKALVPVYNLYILAKICDEKILGRKIVKTYLILLGTMLLLPFIIALTAYLIGSEAALIVLTYLFILALFAGLIYALILNIKLYARFVKTRQAAGWWTIVFVFVPAIAYLYFGFFHNKYRLATDKFSIIEPVEPVELVEPQETQEVQVDTAEINTEQENTTEDTTSQDNEIN